jgi:7,8-dihydropterin-6-yl-methyl-4-(beta-D-ribofuranosyl)aminobenzene 5'-phosphate synthase
MEGTNMEDTARFGQTRNVAVTVVVDNRADLLLESSETVKRFTDEPLLAEHGFAAVVDLNDAGIRILWDAGLTPTALLGNMARMKLDPATIDMIALSHGHGDHTGGLPALLEAMELEPQPRRWERDVKMAEIQAQLQKQSVPLIAHPAAFRERWGIDEDGTKHGPSIVARARWEAAGAQIILAEDPFQLGPGCWTTGSVPRLSFEQAGTGGSRYYREGDAFLPDQVEDDQAIVIHVADKGLVVLAGCAHAGIVNTVNHARRISGVDRVWAVLGGFHLAPANRAEIDRTIDEISRLDPHMVVPSHCTGFEAISRFGQRMPDQFVVGAAGSTYLF